MDRMFAESLMISEMMSESSTDVCSAEERREMNSLRVAVMEETEPSERRIFTC